MGRLTYTMNVSLDGFVETPDHRLDWTTVDEEVHRWFGERNREADALLYGRRLYEVMAAYWPKAGSDPTASAFVLDYARTWNARPKIVFSSTLAEVVPGCRLIRTDAVAELDRLRAEFPGDLLVGGPTLASAFIARDLIDRYDLMVHPVVLGGGRPFFPALDTPLRLRLVTEHRFASGVMHLGYEPLRD